MFRFIRKNMCAAQEPEFDEITGAPRNKAAYTIRNRDVEAAAATAHEARARATTARDRLAAQFAEARARATAAHDRLAAQFAEAAKQEDDEAEFDELTGAPLNYAAEKKFPEMLLHEKAKPEFNEITGAAVNYAAKQLAVRDDFHGVKLALFNTSTRAPRNDAARRIFEVVRANERIAQPLFDEMTGAAANDAARYMESTLKARFSVPVERAVVRGVGGGALTDISFW
jgi:hypothetical protein